MPDDQGFGIFPLGGAPLGFDPVQDPPYRPPPRVLPAAIMFDMSNRTFPLDQDGRYLAMHPVDQWVLLSLSMVQGEAVSDDGLGITLSGITHLTHKVPEHVRIIVRNKLKPKVDSSEIRVNTIHVEVEGNTIKTLVDYTNLVTFKQQIQVAQWSR